MRNLNYYLQLLFFSLLIYIAAYFASLKFGIPFYYIALLSLYFTAFSFILSKQLGNALHAENKNKWIAGTSVTCSVRMCIRVIS